MLYKPNELKSIKSVYEALDSCMETVLISTKKKDITNAISNIKCICTGKCICDLCPEWGKDDYIVMETGRCLVPSRFMQLIVEKHLNTKRWVYIKPLYTDLFNELYSDILPSVVNQESNDGMEDQKWCTYKLSPALIQKALSSIKNERAPALAAKKKAFEKEWKQKEKDQKL